MNYIIGLKICILIFLIKTSEVFGIYKCYECRSSPTDDSCKTIIYKQKKYLRQCGPNTFACFTLEVQSRDILGNYIVRKGCFHGQNILTDGREIEPLGHYHYCAYDSCNYAHELFDLEILPGDLIENRKCLSVDVRVRDNEE
ncbi:uncharacterized protein LOC119615626 [Lucilia sericata]|uniref:uncharacterized protein LOC119615626 n=1 Tax=Lucilia sericata TaxID=13632 RepID=UPI0018A85F2D|nr:uncharacterized protein LOC119615626 [Lucilia sericata]